jgi:[protein-PII] uridylyltransferase
MLATIDAPLPALETAGSLRERFQRDKAELLARFAGGRPSAPAAAALLRALTRLVDQTLLALWHAAAMPEGTALLAVGGYGRGELFPHSDVDVLVLLPATGPKATETPLAAIEGFITACWDTGLEIGSSVRTVAECAVMAQSDVTVQTALLESRYLCGSRRVFNHFRRVNGQVMDAKAFLRAKTLEMRQRHQKYEDTPYSLEPNCKESPGGLRDLQVVIWVARAAGLGKNWAATAVTQLNQILMLNIEERINGSQDAPMRPINEHFLERSGMLEVVSDDLYQREPHAILETFLVFQQTVGLQGLSARTLRALYNARDLMDAKFRRDPVNRATFMQILKASSGQTHAFRLMNQTSVLGRYLWVFRRIVGQMQHDLFHVYTVDQHIITVLRNIRRFLIPEHAHEYPFCSQLASTWDRPYVLYIAALFHDVAKGRGGDHSELGMREARRFCRDHGVDREDMALIEFLVAQHLTMSRIAQKEDLSDPDVIQAFARRVGTERRLTALYLLTVADIRGTSPKVWNAWKGKLLEDLYRLTLRALGGSRPNLAAEIEARKQEARHLLNLVSLPPDVERPLWKTLELSYFARHDAGDIAWHARSLHELVATTQPIVRARLSSLGEGLQVLVYAPDRQDLFARICGYFDSAGFNILDAKIHTTANGYALDTFQVTSPPFEQHYRDLIAFVETQLATTLAASGPLPEPSRGRISRRVKSFPITPRVALRPDERGQRWLLAVSTSDRSGLLYSIARVLAHHHINLQLAKITTLGERVEDTFLVDGPSLQHNRKQLQIETELLDAIAP